MDSQNKVLNVKPACHNVSTRGFSSVVFWDALTNIGVSIDSLHLSRGHSGYVSLGTFTCRLFLSF